MRRPRMSLGSWIFASVLTAVLIPTGAWAATSSSSPVHVTSSTGATDVGVTGSGQLLTAPIAASDVISGYVSLAPGCGAVYTPPAGKGVVLTSITYDIGTGTAGSEAYGILSGDSSCDGPIDFVDTTDGYHSESHTFPTGLPVPVLFFNSVDGGQALIGYTGYLIPSRQLPRQTTSSQVLPTHGK